MGKFPQKIYTLLEKIYVKYKPLSIFLYGSRAGDDFLDNSDFEIGILFTKRNYVSRSEIKKMMPMKDVSIYPFRYEDLKKHQLDTPFQKTIYIRELIARAQTLFGTNYIKKIKIPDITVIDLLQDIRFNIGYAFAAMHSYRNGDIKTASYEFYKSCLYGLRNYLIRKFKKFPVGFKQIYEQSKKASLGEYKELVDKAYKVRKGSIKLQEQDIFENISFLNFFIENQIMGSISKNKGKILNIVV